MGPENDRYGTLMHQICGTRPDSKGVCKGDGCTLHNTGTWNKKNRSRVEKLQRFGF